jgi:hypothetical protein
VASQNNTNLAYTEEEKKKLEAQAAQNGQANTVTQQTTSFAPEVVNSDYSGYLKELYKQQEDAAIADLNAAYNKNVAEVERAEKSIPKQYETARNQAAGASAQAQRNFDIQAAMTGLGSGTGAQAKIARNVALQNNLNAINTAEANAKADLDLKRTQLLADYNNAIAQAKANGNAALAEALYNEMIRAEQQLISQQQFNATLSLQEKQLAGSDSDNELTKEMFNALLKSGSYTPNVQTNMGTTILNPNPQGNIMIPTLTDPNELGAYINNATQNTVTNNGGVYQVGPDGKAPKGLRVGDQVVTAGGTYEITAVNADGSYQSKLVNPTTQPSTGFDYELWGSPDEYFAMVGGNTAMANNISNAIRGSGATKEQQDEMLMEYAKSGAISDEEFQYILYQLGRL